MGKRCVLCDNAIMSNVVPLPRPSRISARVRAAVEARVVQGLSIEKAAEAAGLSRAGFAKALKRPAVQDLVRAVQDRFIRDTEARRSVFKARAFEVALDLMLNAKSEAIRARMAEFLAGDARVSPVAVHVDARQVVRGGYEFGPRPDHISTHLSEH